MVNVNFKVVMLQEYSGAGQSNIVNRFCDGSFYNGPKLTIGFDLRSCRKKKYNDIEIKFQIWDTETLSRFRPARSAIFKRASGYIISFMPGILNHDYQETIDEIKISLTDIEKYLSKEPSIRIKRFPIVLVATKSDLRGSAPDKIWGNQERYDHLVAKVKEHFPEYPVVVTSARDNFNIEEVFDLLAHKMIDFHLDNDKIKLEQQVEQRDKKTKEQVQEVANINSKFFSKSKRLLTFKYNSIKHDKGADIQPAAVIKPILVKLCFLREDGGEGVSSIVRRLHDLPYDPQIEWTIGVTFSTHSVNINQDGINKKVKFELWETGGQRFKVYNSMHIRGSAAFMICCDLSQRFNASTISKHIDDITTYKNIENVMIIFVATKSDLQYKEGCGEMYTKNLEALHQLQVKYRSVVSSVITCSAKDNVNIQEIFIHLAKGVLELRNKEINILPSQKKPSVIVEAKKENQETTQSVQIIPKANASSFHDATSHVTTKTLPTSTANQTLQLKTTTPLQMPVNNSLPTNPTLQQYSTFLSTLPEESLKALGELKEQGADLNPMLLNLTMLQSNQQDLTQRLETVETQTGLDAHTQAEIAYIQNHEHLNRYYQTLKTLLGQTFLAAKVISSSELDASKGISAATIGSIGRIAGALCPPAAPFLSFAATVVGIADGIESYRAAQTLSDWIDLQFIAQLAETIARKLAIAQEPHLTQSLTSQAQGMIKTIQNKCSIIVECIKSGQVLNAQEARALLDANELLSYMKTNRNQNNASLSECVAILLRVIMGSGYVYTHPVKTMQQTSVISTNINVNNQSVVNVQQTTVTSFSDKTTSNNIVSIPTITSTIDLQGNATKDEEIKGFLKEIAELKILHEIIGQKLDYLQKKIVPSNPGSLHAQDNGDGTVSLHQQDSIINTTQGPMPMTALIKTIQTQIVNLEGGLGTTAQIVNQLQETLNVRVKNNDEEIPNQQIRQDLFQGGNTNYQQQKK